MNKKELKAIREKNEFVNRTNPDHNPVPDAPGEAELLAIVKEYNAVEQEQRGRLEKIFAYGRVVEFFGGESWGINQFADAKTGNASLVMERLISSKVSRIKRVGTRDIEIP